ncbi:hypothetical protein D3C81_1948430 [compost metagenome]
MCQETGSVFDIGAVREYPPEQCLVIREIMQTVDITRHVNQLAAVGQLQAKDVRRHISANVERADPRSATR